MSDLPPGARIITDGKKISGLPPGARLRDISGQLMPQSPAEVGPSTPGLESSLVPFNPQFMSESPVLDEFPFLKEPEAPETFLEKVQATARPFLSMTEPNISTEAGRAAAGPVAGMVSSAIPGGPVAAGLAFGAGDIFGETLQRQVPGPTQPLPIETQAQRDMMMERAAFNTTFGLGAGMFTEAFTPVGRKVFGTPNVSEAAQRAEQFSARTISNMTRAQRREIGAPYLSIDAVQDSKLLEGMRGFLAPDIAQTMRATKAAHWANREFGKLQGNVKQSISLQDDARAMVAQNSDLQRWSRLGELNGIKDPDEWVRRIATKSHADVLDEMRILNPELHHDILQKNLELVFQQFSREQPGFAGGRVFNGEALRKWFEQNTDELRALYGRPERLVDEGRLAFSRSIGGGIPPEVLTAQKGSTYQKLDDLTNWLQFTDKATEKAAASAAQASGTQTFQGLLRAGAETTGGAMLVGSQPIETAGLLLGVQLYPTIWSSTLMNPSSNSFKFFRALPGIGKPVRAAIAGESALEFTEGQNQDLQRQIEEAGGFENMFRPGDLSVENKLKQFQNVAPGIPNESMFALVEDYFGASPDEQQTIDATLSQIQQDPEFFGPEITKLIMEALARGNLTEALRQEF